MSKEPVFKDNPEPHIIVNGVPLTEGQSMTVRVALSSFLMRLEEEGLGNDERGKNITKGYIAAGRAVEGFMMKETTHGK